MIICVIFFSNTLLPDRTLVECQLLTLQDVSVHAAALARAGRDNSVQTTSLELALEGVVNLARGSGAGGLLLLDALALLLLRDVGLCLASSAEGRAVVGLVPLSEGGSVDLDNGRAGERVGTDELVVGRVEGHNNDADLAGDALGSPRKVTGLETERTVLGVSTASADKVNSLVADTGVGRLATLLESSI